jgi:hypothetical protein
MPWFERAREVLDQQGARPLRAITDYDEALMYARRGARDFYLGTTTGSVITRGYRTSTFPKSPLIRLVRPYPPAAQSPAVWGDRHPVSAALHVRLTSGPAQ